MNEERLSSSHNAITVKVKLLLMTAENTSPSLFKQSEHGAIKRFTHGPTRTKQTVKLWETLHTCQLLYPPHAQGETDSHVSCKRGNSFHRMYRLKRKGNWNSGVYFYKLNRLEKTWLLGKQNWWCRQTKTDLCLSFLLIGSADMSDLKLRSFPNTVRVTSLTSSLDAEQSCGDLDPSEWLPSCRKQTVRSTLIK